MFERVKNLRDQFVIATDEEKEKIKIELDKLQDEDADAFAEAMVECMIFCLTYLFLPLPKIILVRVKSGFIKK